MIIIRSLCALLALAAAVHAAHLQLLAMPGPSGEPMGLGPVAARRWRGPRPPVRPDVLPSTQALRLLGLSYKSVVADYYWLRCINDYGDGRMAHQHYPNLLPLLRRVIALDPKFVAPYLFAGNVLTLSDMPWHEGLALLEAGSRQRPDAWRIGLSYGINLLMFGQNSDTAAQAVANAAEAEGAPPYLPGLATRMAAEAGQPEIGLTLVDTLLAGTQEPPQIAMLTERRQTLMLEVHLKRLNQAARVYAAEHGHPPKQVSDLLGLDQVQAIPADPLGGAFFIGADGQVKTHHDAERLRVRYDKEPPRAGH